jgi:hypothetical protein
VKLRKSQSKDSISKNDILSKNDKQKIKLDSPNGTIRSTNGTKKNYIQITENMPTLIISDEDHSEVKVLSRNHEHLPLPNNHNRISLGGMVFGLQTKQFSEAPLKNVREKSE